MVEKKDTQKSHGPGTADEDFGRAQWQMFTAKIGGKKWKCSVF